MIRIVESPSRKDFFLYRILQLELLEFELALAAIFWVAANVGFRFTLHFWGKELL